MNQIIILICLVLSLSSCTAVKAVAAMNKSTDRFITLEKDKRVVYEAGAEKFAEIIAEKLDAAIESVERGQYKKFTKPVTIHTCNSVESFTAYCVERRAAGCVLNERLFLAPKNFQPRKEALIHELSHLHMEQQLGMLVWHSRYPSWFQEGLATYISHGEGASKVTPDEARRAIALGLFFTPDLSGNLLFAKTASSYGLKPNMFYRQASLFIEYFHDVDAMKFKALLLSVEEGKDFEKSFSSIYGASLDEIWKKFIQQQKT
ncbi:MAG: hypothetical protein GXP17_00305 [Gammaproteobacteria bacterium]|nr:hypothetical protein [Gammaproteobacteria bacterium]